MHPTTESTGVDSPIPAFIASLIESAASSFEVDITASRDYLFRAFALIRTQVTQRRDTNAHPARGQLATWQTKRIIAYIDANLATELQTKDLANVLHLSVSHFFRAFKVSVGIPPREYIARRRVDLACEIMRATDEPLSQIALGCGLNDQSSFCRVFRRIVGQSPAEWRRANAIEPRPTQTFKLRQSSGTL
jgi:AraC family transcriptional regulator